jgi:Na+/H+-dicarboxylate symporter
VSLLLTFWVLPGLVKVTTGLGHRQVIRLTRDALVTAFVTGNLFIVLPLLTEKVKEMLTETGLDQETSAPLVDVIVPASFNFPSQCGELKHATGGHVLPPEK